MRGRGGSSLLEHWSCLRTLDHLLIHSSSHYRLSPTKTCRKANALDFIVPYLIFQQGQGFFAACVQGVSHKYPSTRSTVHTQPLPPHRHSGRFRPAITNPWVSVTDANKNRRLLIWQTGQEDPVGVPSYGPCPDWLAASSGSHRPVHQHEIAVYLSWIKANALSRVSGFFRPSLRSQHQSGAGC